MREDFRFEDQFGYTQPMTRPFAGPIVVTPPFDITPTFGDRPDPSEQGCTKDPATGAWVAPSPAHRCGAKVGERCQMSRAWHMGRAW